MMIDGRIYSMLWTKMDSLKIGNTELSKDFLKNSNLFISDVIYRYEKMDDHLEDYNMAIEDVLDNADKNYAGKLVSHYAQKYEPR